ncbi:PREDICTED: uncharacterized protein LOC105456883 [Wasmannia auropunctata]|uniref:uncharacterized protein LOC105456883 n=1 Tax=Wasmannia auropunctata TaxID=64793 RepID=UPI0005EF20AD|nr:PREDICTED: uncharacterized protein LOC105456883 [Wasmannia auropunctata]
MHVNARGSDLSREARRAKLGRVCGRAAVDVTNQDITCRDESAFPGSPCPVKSRRATVIPDAGNNLIQDRSTAGERRTKVVNVEEERGRRGGVDPPSKVKRGGTG